MTAIQFLLSAMLIIGVLVYFQRLRSRQIDRLIVVVLALAGLILVARPDWATLIANFLGVTRGADLVTYISLVGLAFLWLSLYTRQRRLEEKLTDMARQLAMLGAEDPDEET
jgi:hypothetical protein